MPYEIRYSNQAVEQLKHLKSFNRKAILDGIEQVLGVNPTVVSKSRVKRLREPAPTEYRLRIGGFRVFYDVKDQTVLVIQILDKQASLGYLGESS
jgi:mRNA-degrading endonuclease RelE of RelBE toxin-antitoxin system